MSNQDQIDYWNGEAGHKWAQRDEQMARLLAPVSEALMDHVGVASTPRALDIGCGGGSGTRLLAERLNPDARILGVDVSEPLLDIARSVSADAKPGPCIEYLLADAASHDFGEERFNLLFSRFGVMFFNDPVQAFTHLHAVMRPGARLAFSCWQALANNPWTALPLKAALAILPRPPAPPPRAPGPFAFADEAYVRDILESSGWQKVDITPHEFVLTWPGEAGYESAVRDLVNTGPVSRLLVEASKEDREAVYVAATEALRDHYRDGRLQLAGAVWLVTAEATH